MQVAVESLRSQVKRLRRFPSVVTFLYSSDQLPPPEVEQAYLDVFHSERWAVGLINSAVRLERLPIPVHLSCVCGAESRTTDENLSWRQSYVHSKLSGVSGVKMAGAHMTAHYFVVYHSAPFSHLFCHGVLLLLAHGLSFSRWAAGVFTPTARLCRSLRRLPRTVSPCRCLDISDPALPFPVLADHGACAWQGWVPPEMWYTDTNWEGTGSAFGFATEISPGAAPLTLDSMKKTVAKDALWDPKTGPTEDWNYHCGAAGKLRPPASLKSFWPCKCAWLSRGCCEQVGRLGRCGTSRPASTLATATAPPRLTT